MKRTLIVLTFGLITYSSFGQWSNTSNNVTQGAVKIKNYLLFDADGDFTGGNYFTIQDDPISNYLRIGYGFNNHLSIKPNGNVGIGTTDPKHKLDINTGGGNLKTYTLGLEYTVNTPGGWARGFRLRNENDNNTAVFGSLNGNAYIAVGFDISEDATGYRNQKFTINRNGNAALKGRFEAKEIKVTTSPTADFVFEDDYNLPTLKSIEKHIKEKKHLPEIASAKEMEKNGVNVGNFQIQLLQKIEELTLYTIEQEKKIKKLEKQQKEIDELKALVQKLLKDKN